MINHASRKIKQGLGVEISDVMEKGKWISNMRNQYSHKESHISKCQSLLNQDTK
jgi:hypothetical protein